MSFSLVSSAFFSFLVCSLDLTDLTFSLCLFSLFYPFFLSFYLFSSFLDLFLYCVELFFLLVFSDLFGIISFLYFYLNLEAMCLWTLISWTVVMNTLYVHTYVRFVRFDNFVRTHVRTIRTVCQFCVHDITILYIQYMDKKGVM